MTKKRTEKFQTAAQLLGPLVVGAIDAANAWPGSLTLQTPSGNVKVALHISGVSPHARKEYEKRFQNPAGLPRPAVSDIAATALPVLLGLDDSEKPNVFVAVDGRSRLGRDTRFSILFHEKILAEARTNGWAVYESTTGERVYAFLPGLLPAFVEQIRANEMLPLEQIAEAVVASGVLDAPEDEAATTMAAKRATKAVNILLRKAGAGRKIRAAYGNTCAMCGLGSNLLQGAHIYPVEAPGSSDEIWNGVSLCHNHHGAFDLHLIWINPTTKDISIHPSLRAEAQQNSGTRHFVESTLDTLALPVKATDRPRKKMFEQRYEYYDTKYTWVK